ncbi:MAG: hypothetical protein R3344_13735 [Acidobacteriota bacterium]|nr:hypothetical protein [Acidobacteriota bacterium]
MRKLLPLVIVIATAVACGPSEHDQMLQSFDEMVAAEHAFARAAADTTPHDAFMKYLADDSILFLPNPVPGRQSMEAREMNGQLSWDPAFADMALSGDLGYTTGPWILSPLEPAMGAGELHGDYITVWKRQPDDSWKVLLDIGIDYSRPPTTATANVASPRLESARAHDGDPVEERDALMELDRAMATYDNFAAAIDANAATDIRFYRVGFPPFIGLAETLDALSESDVQFVWNPIDSGVASSLDLGYTYGTGRLVGSTDPAERVSYLRIWRRGETGNWEVVLDAAIPAPVG